MGGPYKNPVPTVDAIISIIRDGKEHIVLIKRKNPPYGWALPGGFVDYGESLEHAVVREAKEETCLDITEVRQFHAYSDPARDQRQHTISVVFTSRAEGEPEGSDDAAEAKLFTRDSLPEQIAFDHRQILEDYFSGKYR
jgi:ADP-ribose pyrophosphatase YjhB (NUDIX family)